MAYNHNISVKVCGNPESSGGFGPILLLNNPSFVVEDQFYVGFDKNSFFFTITTYQTQTVYKLVKNNVRSSGAFRIGSLVIAISIPKNYKLEGGYTPYDVLCALKDEFLKKCMTCKDPVRETYEYNASKIDGHVLDEVVGKFTLTCFRTPDRVMTPNGPVGYIVETEEKIKELFQDINYPEFDKFKEVVVATTVHTTSYVPISNIQIPRPKKYELIVDGQPQGNCCNLNERLKIICRSKSPLYYEDLSFVFSIQDLIDRPERHEGVVLDTVQERVVVNTDSWGKPKKKKVSLAISPKEYEDYFISNPQELKVTFPHCSIMSKKVVISQQRLAFTLLGNEIATLKNGGIKVLTTQSKYEVTDQLLIKGELRVTVVPKERSIPAPAGNLTVKVGFSEDKDLKDKCSVDLQVINSSDGKSLYSEKGVVLKWNSQTKKYEGSFVIDRKDVSPFAFFLTCSTKNKDWRTDKIIARDNPKKVDADFSEEPRPFTDRYRKPLVCVLVTMMALVLGGLSFVLYNNLYKGTSPTTEKETFTEKDVKPFLSEVDRLLKTKDLEFSTVESLHEKYRTNKDTIDAYGRSMTNFFEICQRLDDYNKVIGFIQQGDVESIEKVVKNCNLCKLNDIHMKVLQEIVANDTTKNLFEGNRENLNSFADIRGLYERHKDETHNDSVISSWETEPAEETKMETEKKKSKKESPKHKYTCDMCGSDTWFYTEKELTNHKKSIHTQLAGTTTRFVCSVCNKNYKTKKQLELHMKTHDER